MHVYGSIYLGSICIYITWLLQDLECRSSCLRLVSRRYYYDSLLYIPYTTIPTYMYIVLLTYLGTYIRLIVQQKPLFPLGFLVGNGSVQVALPKCPSV